MTLQLCLISGDGIGPEVVPSAVQVLLAVLPDLTVTEAAAGWSVFEQTGTALPSETRVAARAAGAILFGAVSSPSHPVPGYRSPIVALRRELDTFANLRPARTWLRKSPLDLLVVRENTEGLYRGEERSEIRPDGTRQVITDRLISQVGSERVARLACRLAVADGRRVTIVHKANVIRQGDGLWRETCLAVAAEFPGLAVDEALADAAAYHLVRTPERYQLLLCPNLYGDILSDLASGLADGLGMAPSLSLGLHSAIAEPVHGSAPDIAGQGIANPIATILSGAMLCRHWWERPQAAERIEQAVMDTLASGLRTPDIAQGTAHPVDTKTMVGAVLDRLNG